MTENLQFLVIFGAVVLFILIGAGMAPTFDRSQWGTDQEEVKPNERTVRIAIGLNLITEAAALVGAFGLYILYGTLIEARNAGITAANQARTAQQELELSERPWVYPVKVTVAKSTHRTLVQCETL